MKRKITISVLVILLIVTGSFIFLTYNKPSIDSVAKKIVKSNPNATIENINTEGILCKPTRILSVNIGKEKIQLYEFKDKDSIEKALPILTDGSIEGSSIVDSKDNIVIKYIGNNENIINQFKGLIH